MLARRRPYGLAALPVGARARVTVVDLAPRQRLRLAELGVRPGTLVVILGRTPGDGRVLGFGASRLALDARTVRRLQGTSA